MKKNRRVIAIASALMFGISISTFAVAGETGCAKPKWWPEWLPHTCSIK